MPIEIFNGRMTIPNTQWLLLRVVLVQEMGNRFEGVLHLVPEGAISKQVIGWVAIYQQTDGSFKITGPGAILPGGSRVHDSSRAPFSLDDTVNYEIIKFIRGLLCKRLGIEDVTTSKTSVRLQTPAPTSPPPEPVFVVTPQLPCVFGPPPKDTSRAGESAFPGDTTEPEEEETVTTESKQDPVSEKTVAVPEVEQLQPTPRKANMNKTGNGTTDHGPFINKVIAAVCLQDNLTEGELKGGSNKTADSRGKAVFILRTSDVPMPQLTTSLGFTRPTSVYPVFKWAKEEVESRRGEFFLGVQRIKDFLDGKVSDPLLGGRSNGSSPTTKPSAETDPGQRVTRTRQETPKPDSTVTSEVMTSEDAIFAFWCLFDQDVETLARIFKVPEAEVKQAIGTAVMKGSSPERIKDLLLTKLQKLKQ